MIFLVRSEFSLFITRVHCGSANTAHSNEQYPGKTMSCMYSFFEKRISQLLIFGLEVKCISLVFAI